MNDEREKIARAIEFFRTARVLVGFPSDGEQKFGLAPGMDRRLVPDINNATLGYIHEHGAAVANIPPRPFMREGISLRSAAIGQRLGDAAREALRGNIQGVERNFHAAGLIAQAGIRAKITEGPFTPLAPRTIAKRRARGNYSIKPLIDTGQLRLAVSYVIRMRPL